MTDVLRRDALPELRELVAEGAQPIQRDEPDRGFSIARRLVARHDSSPCRRHPREIRPPASLVVHQLVRQRRSLLVGAQPVVQHDPATPAVRVPDRRSELGRQPADEYFEADAAVGLPPGIP